MSTALHFGELGRGLLGLLLGVLFGLCGLLLADQPLHEIGVSMLSSPDVLGPALLLGVPVGMGFWSGVVSAYGRDRGLLTACLAALGALPTLLALRWEQAADLAFLAPFLAVLTLWGALLGWWVVARANRNELEPTPETAPPTPETEEAAVEAR